MGWQEDVYNIYGNGTYLDHTTGKMIFRGCRNLCAINQFASDLGMDSPTVQVNMMVCAGAIGHLMDVRPGGLVEHVITKMGLAPYRVMDTTNAIRFSVSKQDWQAIICPKHNDWTITTKGSVIVRMTWDKVMWTHEIENNVLQTCNEYMKRIKTSVDDFLV